jgi:hypothetical protein
MPRSDFNYAQTYIGSCGHLVGGWPAVSKIGGADPVVPCDECTREQWALAGNESPAVWVRMKEPTRSAKQKAAKKSVPKKVKPPAPWEVILDGIERERKG